MKSLSRIIRVLSFDVPNKLKRISFKLNALL